MRSIQYTIIFVICIAFFAEAKTYRDGDYASSHERLTYKPEEVYFEVEVSKSFNGPIQLNDGRLYAIYYDLIATCSSDGGKTWNDLGALVDKQGKKITGNKLRPYSIIRLQSGAIAINYWETLEYKNQQINSMETIRTYFIKSLDEGKTWSDPVQVNLPGTPAWPQWMIQTSTGRLVMANEYFYMHPERRSMGICACYYSDDEGETWHESPEGLFYWDQKGAVIAQTEVPCITETADGRLLMFMRNKMQRIAQSYSDDNGTHWQTVTFNDLVSSIAEIWLTTIPTTGDLLCVWNQATTEEINNGFYRARLTSAISKDSGKTWENFRTVINSPGMEKISRIANPGPPAFMETSMPVPPAHLVPSEGFWMNRHPRVRFIGDRAYILYEHRVYQYPNPAEEWVRVYNARRMRVVPIEWFYGKDK